MAADSPRSSISCRRSRCIRAKIGAYPGPRRYHAKNSVYLLPNTEEAARTSNGAARLQLGAEAALGGKTHQAYRRRSPWLALRAREEDHLSLAADIRKLSTRRSVPCSPLLRARGSGGSPPPVSQTPRRDRQDRPFGAPGRKPPKASSVAWNSASLRGHRQERLRARARSRSPTCNAAPGSPERASISTGSPAPGSSGGSSTSSRPSSSSLREGTPQLLARYASTCSTPSSPTTASSAPSR